MKIHILSDLHLEFDDNREFETFTNSENADTLILAGDIFTAKTFKLDYVQNFFKNVSKQYKNVLFIFGNHEYYKGTFNTLINRIVPKLPANVTFLNNSSVEIDDITFIGSTLWTNYNNNCFFTKRVVRNKLNDYRVIKNVNVEILYQEHLRSIFAIETLYSVARTDKVVGIFHHGISPQSIAPEFRADREMNGAYMSDLREFFEKMPKFKLLIHGHTHTSFDYILDNELQNQRVICNPRGYARFEMNPNFNRDLVVEI